MTIKYRTRLIDLLNINYQEDWLLRPVFLAYTLFFWNNYKFINLELIQYIAENFYDDTISIINRIDEALNENSIKRVVYQYEDMVITENIKMLLCRFLMERKNRIVEIYKKKEGINE